MKVAAAAAIAGLALGCVTTSVGVTTGPGGATVSCEQSCHERTAYGERCVDFARQATWCEQLLHPDAPPGPSDRGDGWAAGTPVLACGCYGPWPPGALADPVCESGLSEVTACPAWCPMGGIQYGYVCS